MSVGGHVKAQIIFKDHLKNDFWPTSHELISTRFYNLPVVFSFDWYESQDSLHPSFCLFVFPKTQA